VRNAPRHLQQYCERFQPEPTRAQRSTPLEPALVVLGLSDPLSAEGEWRLKAQTQLLSQIFGLRSPRSTPGTRTCPRRVWGLCPCSRGAAIAERLATLWRRVEDKSPATRSR
jgi:hypothetical protein